MKNFFRIYKFKLDKDLFKLDFSFWNITNIALGIVLVYIYGLKEDIVIMTLCGPMFGAIFVALTIFPYYKLYKWAYPKIHKNRKFLATHLDYPTSSTQNDAEEQLKIKELYCQSPSLCLQKYKHKNYFIETFFFWIFGIFVTPIVIICSIVFLITTPINILTNTHQTVVSENDILFYWVVLYFFRLLIIAFSKNEKTKTKFIELMKLDILRCVLIVFLIFAPCVLISSFLITTFTQFSDNDIIPFIGFILLILPIQFNFDNMVSSKETLVEKTPKISDTLFDFDRDEMEEQLYQNQPLKTPKKSKKSADDELLTTKQAATFIEKSVLYLIRKRRIDNYYSSIHNLPFQIKEGEFVYSKKALLSYKEKKWNTLKKL